jgi:hypothetical protein
MRIGDITKENWAQLWASEDGKKFRVALALMFVTCPPNTAPAESDYRAYYWELRDIAARKRGADQLVNGMERAGRTADKFRPSAGSVRAHAYESNPEPTRALPAKPFVPMTDAQLDEMRADIKRRAWRMDANEALKSKKTEQHEAKGA